MKDGVNIGRVVGSLQPRQYASGVLTSVSYGTAKTTINFNPSLFLGYWVNSTTGIIYNSRYLYYSPSKGISNGIWDSYRSSLTISYSGTTLTITSSDETVIGQGTGWHWEAYA